MIRVTVTTHEREYSSIYCIGHAEYADTDDIVCAAVSVLVINTINSIETLTEDPYSVGEDPERGMIDFRLTGHVSHDSRLLIDAMLLGIRQVQDTYGEMYVSLIQQEV